MLRFLADWQEADDFLRDKIAQAKTDEPITTLAALDAAEKLVRTVLTALGTGFPSAVVILPAPRWCAPLLQSAPRSRTFAAS